MKIGKRDQTKIDKELLQFFSWLTLSGNGIMLYQGFKDYLEKRNMQVVVDK